MGIKSLWFVIASNYKRALKKAFSTKYLFYTNVCLSIGISTVGDLVEQSREYYYTKEIDEFDFYRTAHMSFSGSLAGTYCHYWYIFLDKVIVGKSLGMVVKKLMLDQCICSPCLILIFFASVAIFEDDPIENFDDEVRTKFWTLYKAEWVVWPPAQIINFYFLPTKYRVLYDNTISLGYDIYTSQVKHERPQKEEILVEELDKIKKELEEKERDERAKDDKRPEMQILLMTWKKAATSLIKSKSIERIKQFSHLAFTDKYLLYTNVTISITLSSLGDFLEQQYEIYNNEMEKWDKTRTMHMAFSGGAVGVLCHNWYKTLDRHLIGKTTDVIVKKLLLDQLIFSPIMISTFFASVAVFEEKPLDNFVNEVRKKFPALYKAEWIIWPPAQVINFYFLPTRFRVLYDNIISLGYDIYASKVKYKRSDS